MRVLSRLQMFHLSRRQRFDPGSTGPLWGGILGAVLLGWCVLVLLAPELGLVVAVFGSPLLSLFVIVRLLTAPADAGQQASTGKASSRPGSDAEAADRG